MTDDVNALGYFLAGSPNLPLRQKLALAMLAKSRKAPQNLGEGIASMGQSFADAMMQRSTLDEDSAALQTALTAKVPPIADSAVPPTPPPQASVIPDNRPNIVPAQPQQANIVRPPTPLPPDLQQDPNSPITRMPTQPVRGAAVMPDIPPGQPGNTGADRFPPPLQTTPAQRDAAVLPPPVVAQGDEDPRRAIGAALLRQQMGGTPPPAPAAAPPPQAAAPSTPPPQTIPAAPQQQPIRAIPTQGDEQPKPISGYVPPEAGRPEGAPTIQPGPQEQQLQALSAANAGNPHWSLSQPARVLQALVTERERKQKEADKWHEAQLTRGNKQSEQRTSGLMDQTKRINEDLKTGLELGALPARLEQEERKRAQELVGGGVTQQGPDPYIGTPRSRQRSGVPKIDPVPEGAIPEVWVKDQTAKVAKTAETLDSAKPELSEALNLIKKARAHPAKERSLGAAGGLARLTPEGQGFAAIVDQLKGKTFLSGYQKLKGTGNVSEIEGLKTEQAQARLATAQTEKDFDDALQDLETSLRGGVERVERKMNRPVTAYQKTPDDPYAPDLGEKRGGFEYIGGDPADKRNWKRAK